MACSIAPLALKVRWRSKTRQVPFCRARCFKTAITFGFLRLALNVQIYLDLDPKSFQTSLLGLK